MKVKQRLRVGLLGMVVAEAWLCGAAVPVLCAQMVYPEVEPNNSKLEATLAGGEFGMFPGDAVTGTTTSTSTAGLGNSDIFLIRTSAAPPRIYRYHMEISSANPAPYTSDYSSTILGLYAPGCQPRSDVELQHTFTGTFAGQWYGFGKQERVYWRVGGSIGTPQPYTATLFREEVASVAELGPFRPGLITIAAASSTLPHASSAIYDSSFNLVPQQLAGVDITVTATLAPGVYYVALVSPYLYDNQGSPDFCTGAFFGYQLDFPNCILNGGAGSSTTAFRLRDSTMDSNHGFVLPLTTHPHEIAWIQIRVFEPLTCGSGDFNGDGDVGTSQDIEAFFACIAGDCCPTCDPRGADFNGDGDVATDADIEAFFRVIAGGGC